MAELISNFDHLALEEEMRLLANEINDRVKVMKITPEVKKFKEIIRESLEAVKTGSSVDNKKNNEAVGQANFQSSVLPEYMNSLSPEVKLRVERLVDDVFHKGLGKTIIEAKKEGPFFLDAFHDILSGRLYHEMKKRGLI